MLGHIVDGLGRQLIRYVVNAGDNAMFLSQAVEHAVDQWRHCFSRIPAFAAMSSPIEHVESLCADR
jgi:hypothetical protein